MYFVAAYDVDEQRVMISALEHDAYCPRQCTLLLVERSCEENARGRGRV